MLSNNAKKLDDIVDEKCGSYDIEQQSVEGYDLFYISKAKPPLSLLKSESTYKYETGDNYMTDLYNRCKTRSFSIEVVSALKMGLKTLNYDNVDMSASNIRYKKLKGENTMKSYIGDILKHVPINFIPNVDIRNTIIENVTNHFGITVESDTTHKSKKEYHVIVEWVQKHDPKFKNHIYNPYTIDPIKKVKNKSKKSAYIKGNFIIKLETGTYAMVTGSKFYSESKESNVYSVKVYLFGKKCYKYLKELRRMVNDHSDESTLYSYYVTDDGESNFDIIRSKLGLREFNTIFLNDGIEETIKIHLDTWKSQKDIYNERGLIYKTGILLYGKPGTGKSSVATAIANYLNASLITFAPSTFSDVNLPFLTVVIDGDDKMYVVLLDEIDGLIKDEGTFKDLLLFLDSPQSPSNVVFVGTTNHIENIRPELKREGRFNLCINLDDINEKAAFDMCRNFGISERATREILSDCTFPINPSSLEQTILRYINK